MRVGFFINPRAGYGVIIGRKGSDSLPDIDPNLSTSVTVGKKFLNGVRDLGIHFLVPSGIMGSEELDALGIKDYEVTSFPGKNTDASDTVSFIRSLKKMEPQLIIFCGGDGTARDILSAGTGDVPVLGVPAGIKMESSVFAISLQHAIYITREIAGSGTVETVVGEVVDIPESDLDTLHPSPEFYGELITPSSQDMVSSPKLDFYQGNPEGIVDYVIETMDPSINYIIGPGSTCKSIIARLGKETGLLGFDLVKAGEVLESDISEQRIYELADKGGCKLVLSPVGGQNFLLGRGNKQISSRVIKALDFRNVIVVSAPEKLTYTKRLYIDLDTSASITIPRYIRVITGYGMFKIVELEG